MVMRLLPIILLLIGSVFAQQAEFVPGTPIVPPKDPGRSESSTGQFTVFGQPLELRGTVASYLERRKKAVARLLGRSSAEWSLPVRVKLFHPNEFSGMGGVVRSVELVDGMGLRGIITVGFGRGFTLRQLDEALVGTLLAETALPGGLLPRTEGEVVPAWLIAGVEEALEYRENGRPGATFRSIMERGDLLEIEELFKGSPASGTPVERAVYRASSGALVLALLGQPDGSERLGFLLEDFRKNGTSSSASRKALREHFPTLRLSGDSLEKWWALEMASLAEPEVQEMMSASDTETALENALQIPLPEIEEVETVATAEPEKKGIARWFRSKKEKSGEDQNSPATLKYKKGLETPLIPVAEYRKILARPDRAKLVSFVRNRLIIVEMRGFHMLKPVVQDYREVLDKIDSGSSFDVDAALAQLTAQRESILQTTSDVSSYLDWFEATQRDERSGEFDDYFRALRREANSSAKPQSLRRNVFSQALDDFENGTVPPAPGGKIGEMQ